MITVIDALAIGRAIAKARVKEQSLIDGMVSDGTMNQEERNHRTIGIRGATYVSLQEIWYEVLPEIVRAKFGHSYQQYLTEVHLQ